LNVDGCRVEGEIEGDPNRFAKTSGGEFVARFNSAPVVRTNGRWPANLIHDGSDEVVGLFPVTGASKSGGKAGWQDEYVGGKYKPIDRTGYDEPAGSAARFFYCAKASKLDRDEGCDGMELKKAGAMTGKEYRPDRPTNHPMRSNSHPTVKPTDLMRYLCRLVTPPGGTVLDPFAGSGSTGKAAALEGFGFIGIEREEEYVEIARARIAHAVESAKNVQSDLFN
jgi:site-specific DNA-methyltransferase (adenine-specific)